MTDPTDPLDPDLDDLASAHLDGLTTAAEAARIAADPELTLRVAQMGAVREAVRATGGPVDEARREQAVAAALAAYDAIDAPGAEAGARTPDLAVPPRLDDRRRQAQRRLRLAGAAAAIALLALAVPLLSRMGSDDDDADVAATALEDDAAGRDESAADQAQGEAGGDVGTPVPSAAGPETFAVADLGAHDDLDALTESVRAQLAGGADGAAPTTTTARTADDTGGTDGDTGTAGSGGCPSDPDRGRLVLSAGASLEGQPVIVSVYEEPTGALELVVIAAGDCSLVDTRPL